MPMAGWRGFTAAGGGRGAAGQALANAGVKALPSAGLAMGFARLSGGRTTVIVDAASPPGGGAGRHAHASTNAFELTSGRRPVIVSCGSGAPFGPDWRQAGRATASHSTLAVEGYSSSRLGPIPKASCPSGPRCRRCGFCPAKMAPACIWRMTAGP